MIPYIETPLGTINTYTVMIAVGALSMFIALHIILKNSVCRESEEIYIFPKIVISGLFAFVSSALFDALFKISENGGFVLKGITFYGGLIGSIICMFILIKFSKKNTEYSVKQWYDILTIPLIIFHFFGRIGCYLGGCCYGKTTESIFGVYFPDNIKDGIIHNGQKCYPTQLFEAFALIIILILVFNSRKKFGTYLFSYAVARFFIEFLRGDNRGAFILGLSPAQIISILILMCLFVYNLKNKPLFARKKEGKL